jgi:hypothetical protein
VKSRQKGTLVVAVLTVRSSYRRDVEQPVRKGEVPDTLQWWITADIAWRIKTFALDHDIHVYSLRPRHGQASAVRLAQESNRKHYGDVIAAQHVVELDGDTPEARRALQKVGLAPNLSTFRDGALFWTPDRARYRTQSRPR